MADMRNIAKRGKYQDELVFPINSQRIKRVIVFLNIHAKLAYKA